MQASPIPEPTPEPPVALKEYSTGYDTLLKWISTRQEQLASPDFPKTAEDTQRLLDKFRRQRAIEKEKEKRKKELGEMEEELTEFHRKHEKDFHLPQFTELEKVDSSKYRTIKFYYQINYLTFLRCGFSTNPLVTPTKVH